MVMQVHQIFHLYVQVSGAYTVNLKLDLIDHEMKRSIEVLQGGWNPPPGQGLQRHESRRYAAVLVLREIAFSMPTFFFQVTCKICQIGCVNAWWRHDERSMQLETILSGNLARRPIWLITSFY